MCGCRHCPNCPIWKIQAIIRLHLTFILSAVRENVCMYMWVGGWVLKVFYAHR